MTTVVNWVLVALGIISCWYQWRAYRILRSPAFLVLMIAMVYLTVYRAALPLYPSMTDYGLVMPFFLLLVAHGALMTRSLQGVLDATPGHAQRINPGVLHWWRHMDRLLVALVMLGVFVVIGLEIWELLRH